MFSIYSFIADTRKDYPTLGPVELTEKVLASLSQEDERPALEQCLRWVTSAVISKDRAGGAPKEELPKEGGIPGKPNSKSWKNRVPWSACLERPSCAKNVWKAFGDWDLADIRDNIERRESEAAALLHNANLGREYESACLRYNATKIRDLPEAVLRPLIERGTL